MTTKTTARWIAIGALFLIPFLSLYISSSLYFPFITGKNFAFRILVELAFAGWLVLIACDPKYRPRFSWTLVWYTALTAWMAVANLMAVNPHKAFWSNYERMDGWVTLAHLLVLLAVMAAVLSAENLWRKWWLAFIAGNALVCVYGLAQLAGLAQIHQGGVRLDATLGNAEYFAGYLLFAVAITLWQAFETSGKDQAWLRYGLFALSILQVVMLFATGTRGTLVGFVAAAAFGSALWVLEAGKQGRKIAVSILAVLVLLVGGLFVLRDAPIVMQSQNLERLTSVFNLKDALGTRLTIWDMTIEGIKERPLAGWGQEGFNYVFNRYYQPSLYGQEPWFDRAHNLYLDWAVAGGIPALLLFLLACLAAAWALYRAPISRFERVFLLSALAGYAVQGLVVFDNLFTYIPFVAILAMAHRVSSRPIGVVERARAVNDTRLDTVVGPAAIAVGALLVWFVNVPSVFAGTNLIKALTPVYSADERLQYFKDAVDNGGFAHQEIAEQLLTFASQTANSASVPLATRQAVVDYAGEQMNAELARAPQDARLHLQYAFFYRSIQAYDEAQQESAVARSLSPYKQSILLEQGIEAFQKKEYEAAKEYFSKAYELDTEFTDLAGYAAAAEIAGGDVASGKKILQEAFGTTTVNHQMLVLAYYQIKDWDDLIDVLRLKAEESDDATAGFQLAAAYSEAGRRQDAIAQVRATVAAHPDAKAQGEALLKQLGAQ